MWGRNILRPLYCQAGGLLFTATYASAPPDCLEVNWSQVRMRACLSDLESRRCCVDSTATAAAVSHRLATVHWWGIDAARNQSAVPETSLPISIIFAVFCLHLLHRVTGRDRPADSQLHLVGISVPNLWSSSTPMAWNLNAWESADSKVIVIALWLTSASDLQRAAVRVRACLSDRESRRVLRRQHGHCGVAPPRDHPLVGYRCGEKLTSGP